MGERLKVRRRILPEVISTLCFCLIQCRNSTTKEKPYVYVYSNGEEQRTYHPVNGCLQEIGKHLQSAIKKPWEIYLKEGLTHLQVAKF